MHGGSALMTYKGRLASRVAKSMDWATAARVGGDSGANGGYMPMLSAPILAACMARSRAVRRHMWLTCTTVFMPRRLHSCTHNSASIMRSSMVRDALRNA